MKPNRHLVTVLALGTFSALFSEPLGIPGLMSVDMSSLSGVIQPRAVTLADEKPLNKTELRKLLENTQWLTNEGPGKAPRSLVFRKDGEITDSQPAGGKYRFFTVEVPDILKIYHHDPKKDRKADFVLLRINVAAMTAQQDAKASTIEGAMLLKYEGPAKPGK